MGSYLVLPYTDDFSLSNIESLGVECYSYTAHDHTLYVKHVADNNTTTIIGFYGNHRVIAALNIMSGSLSHFTHIGSSDETIITFTSVSATRYNYGYSDIEFDNISPVVESYSSKDELFRAFDAIMRVAYPITYRLTNCTAPDAPTEAAVGDSVSVSFVYTEGYGITDNTNVYVTNNGVIVPSTYSDGVLTFEMPDPN